jgi:hypothetical protein
MDEEQLARRLVQSRIGRCLRLAAEQIWLERGGLQLLDWHEAHEYAELIGRMERLAKILEHKAKV